MVRVKPDYASYRRKPIRGPLFQKRCSTDPAIPLSITVPGREWNATDGTPERRPVAEFRCGILPPHPGARFRTRCRRVAPEEIVMKTTQYVRQEKSIASADSGGIRQRWLYGLRLLRDPDAFAQGSSQPKPGCLDELAAAAKARGFKLSRREIQYRLQCARTYQTEAEIAHACAQFEDWSELRSANFPAYPVPADEPPADHRTDAERDHDHARALVDLIGEQGSLFPLRDFEPVTTTLKELVDYTEQQESLTARFVEHGRKRRAYLDDLIEAVDNDLSATWQQAQERLNTDGAS